MYGEGSGYLSGEVDVRGVAAEELRLRRALAALSSSSSSIVKTLHLLLGLLRVLEQEDQSEHRPATQDSEQLTCSL